MKKLLLITGARNSGKTALVLRAAAEIGDSGGVCSPAEVSCGEKMRYFVRSLRSGRELPLLRRTAAGPRINAAGFKFANSVIRRNARRKVLFVDEYGPLEERGGGFYAALLSACVVDSGALVLAVRKSLLESASSRLQFNRYKMLDLDSMGQEKALKCLLKFVA